MKIQLITLALTFMPLAAQERLLTPEEIQAADAKAAKEAKKEERAVRAEQQRISSGKLTVDDVMALSVIAEYTDVEDMELAKVANNPRKTRDLLARMHTRRERAAWNRYEQLKAERDSRILTPPQRWEYIEPMRREWQTWVECATAASKLRTLQFK